MKKYEANAFDSKEIICLVKDIKRDILSTRNKILSDANKELIFYILELARLLVKIKNKVLILSTLYRRL